MQSRWVQTNRASHCKLLAKNLNRSLQVKETKGRVAGCAVCVAWSGAAAMAHWERTYALADRDN